MSFFKPALVWLFIFPAVFLSQQKALAQHAEIGIRVVLSGAIMFGPCFTYWVDDHNALNCSVLAAYEGDLIVPFALNAGYSAYFFNHKWRPETGLQYSYLISPVKHKTAGDPNGISVLSLMPGVQFRWDNTNRNAESRVWFAYIFAKHQPVKKIRILPIGLDFSYGYKFR